MLIRNLFFVALLICCFQSVGAANWDGSKAKPGLNYELNNDTCFIKDALGLAWVAYVVNSDDDAVRHDFYGCTVTLENDIDLAGNTWIPIGKDLDHPFKGIFSNKEKRSVSGIDIVDAGRDGLAALFGYVVIDYARVNETNMIHYNNLVFDGNVRVSAAKGDLLAASFIARMDIVSTGNITFYIQNCDNYVDVYAEVGENSADGSFVIAAGLIGAIYDKSDRGECVYFNNIVDCMNYAHIESVSNGGAVAYAAGVFGRFYSDGTINGYVGNASSAGHIRAHSKRTRSYAAGVIVEYVVYGRIDNQKINIKSYILTGSIKASSDSDLSMAAAVACILYPEDKFDLNHNVIPPGGSLEMEGDIVENNGIVSENEEFPVPPNKYSNLIDLSKLESGLDVNGASMEVVDGRYEITLESGDFKVMNKNENEVNISCLNDGYVLFTNAEFDRLVLGADVTHKSGIDNTICSSLVMYDGCQVGYISNKGEIEYYRNHKIFNTRNGDGWETICLPFDATLYLDGVKKGHFYKKDGITVSGNYWAYEFDSFDGVSFSYNLTFSPYFEAGKAYMMCMPGEQFGSLSFENKADKIVFKGFGNIDPSKFDVIDSDNSMLCPIGAIDKVVSDVYVLNGPDETKTVVYDESGDTFRWTENQVVMRPFRAYVNVVEMELWNQDPSMMCFVFEEFEATGIDESVRDNKILIHVENGRLIIETQNETDIDIYSIDGRIVKSVKVDGRKEISDFVRGVYVVEGEKVII